ncbi:MAG: flagellar protein FlgN [Oscillospiraceae bacterium]|nr:flagellar protein FlgN [Oscillospiraceae bacterium]
MIEVTELRGRLKERNDALRQIWEITREQPALIEGEETERLLENIARRQNLIDTLVKLTDGLPEERRRARDPECAALDQESHELYTRIAEQDKTNENTAQARLDDIKERLRALRDGKTAFTAYEKAGGDPGATYFDKKR